MGLISNVLVYGWNAGCIITEAEREADRICKNNKTTVIEADEETKMGESSESDDNSCDFQIIFHPEWLSKEDGERMKQNDHCGSVAVNGIKEALIQ